MNLMVAALLFLTLLEICYCSPLYYDQMMQAGAPYRQWPQLNEEYTPFYFNKIDNMKKISKESGPNASFGFNFANGLIDIGARKSLYDKFDSNYEHHSVNMFAPDPTIANQFANFLNSFPHNG